MKKIYLLCGILISSLLFHGCMGVRTNKKADRKADKIIDNLTVEVESLNTELLKVKREKEQEIQKLKNAQSSIIDELQKEIEMKDAQVEMKSKGLVITFLTQIFFDSGRAKVKKEGREALDKISKTLREIDRQIRIEGHTDNDPIRRSKFLYKSNWELSAARAMSVLHILQENGIKSTLLSGAGYGEYSPIKNNDTKANKSKNRRVEIVILPKEIKIVEKNKGCILKAKKESKCNGYDYIK